LTQILIFKKVEKEIVFESSVLAWIRNRIRIKQKCWIRIRIKSIRIHNPAKNTNDGGRLHLQRLIILKNRHFISFCCCCPNEPGAVVRGAAAAAAAVRPREAAAAAVLLAAPGLVREEEADVAAGAVRVRAATEVLLAARLVRDMLLVAVVLAAPRLVMLLLGMVDLRVGHINRLQ
jgi:hypothetical protein